MKRRKLRKKVEEEESSEDEILNFAPSNPAAAAYADAFARNAGAYEGLKMPKNVLRADLIRQREDTTTTAAGETAAAAIDIDEEEEEDDEEKQRIAAEEAARLANNRYDLAPLMTADQYKDYIRRKLERMFERNPEPIYALANNVLPRKLLVRYGRSLPRGRVKKGKDKGKEIPYDEDKDTTPFIFEARVRQFLKETNLAPFPDDEREVTDGRIKKTKTFDVTMSAIKSALSTVRAIHNIDWDKWQGKPLTDGDIARAALRVKALATDDDDKEFNVAWQSLMGGAYDAEIVDAVFQRPEEKGGKQVPAITPNARAELASALLLIGAKPEGVMRKGMKASDILATEIAQLGNQQLQSMPYDEGQEFAMTGREAADLTNQGGGNLFEEEEDVDDDDWENAEELVADAKDIEEDEFDDEEMQYDQGFVAADDKVEYMSKKELKAMKQRRKKKAEEEEEEEEEGEEDWDFEEESEGTKARVKALKKKMEVVQATKKDSEEEKPEVIIIDDMEADEEEEEEEEKD